ncbi:hypothetical protein C2W62_32695 [Candidatus Entotheonella serta]|nr:hypothetical protein C2W62_32695 [Candidatus Entotheonella serta]
MERRRFHYLRHTCATLLLQQGVHAKVVSELLGHSSIGLTLDTYSHVLPDMQQSRQRDGCSVGGKVHLGCCQNCCQMAADR